MNEISLLRISNNEANELMKVYLVKLG